MVNRQRCFAIICAQVFWLLLLDSAFLSSNLFSIFGFFTPSDVAYKYIFFTLLSVYLIIINRFSILYVFNYNMFFLICCPILLYASLSEVFIFSVLLFIYYTLCGLVKNDRLNLFEYNRNLFFTGVTLFGLIYIIAPFKFSIFDLSSLASIYDERQRFREFEGSIAYRAVYFVTPASLMLIFSIMVKKQVIWKFIGFGVSVIFTLLAFSITSLKYYLFLPFLFLYFVFTVQRKRYIFATPALLLAPLLLSKIEAFVLGSQVILALIIRRIYLTPGMLHSYVNDLTETRGQYWGYVFSAGDFSPYPLELGRLSYRDGVWSNVNYITDGYVNAYALGMGITLVIMMLTLIYSAKMDKRGIVILGMPILYTMHDSPVNTLLFTHGFAIMLCLILTHKLFFASKDELARKI